jgi:hypothetical protein
MLDGNLNIGETAGIVKTRKKEQNKKKMVYTEPC